MNNLAQQQPATAKGLGWLYHVDPPFPVTFSVAAVQAMMKGRAKGNIIQRRRVRWLALLLRLLRKYLSILTVMF